MTEKTPLKKAAWTLCWFPGPKLLLKPDRALRFEKFPAKATPSIAPKGPPIMKPTAPPITVDHQLILNSQVN